MNFVINGRFLTQELTGVQRFAVQIVRELCHNTGTITILVPKSNLKLSLDEGNAKIVEIGYLSSHLWEQIELPIWLNRNGRPILINLCNTAPLLYQDNAVVIHDLAFLKNPSWFSYPFRIFYSFLIPKLLKHSKIIFTVSETIKSQIIKYFPETKDTTVIYNAASTSFRIISGLTKEKIILTVGSIDPRKNLKTLIKAFQMADLEDYKLMIVGEQNSNFNTLELNELPNNIIFTGRVSDDELVKFYNQAELFVYLSFYEGFGIPPLEAQQCGLPIIVSDIDVFNEVYGTSAILCNPNDESEISDSIRFIVDNPSQQLSYSQISIHNSEKYTWKASADRIYEVIKKFSNQ